MKKFNKRILFFLLLAIPGSLFAQPPAAIPFQVVAKDPQGNPARNRTIHVRDAIIHSTATGTMMYEETHQVRSDNDGVFNILIGRGTATAASPLGSISQVSWGNGPYFFNLKLAIAPSIPASWWVAANNYVDMGTTQMMSVPYALYAANASVTNVNTSIAAGPINTFLVTDSTGKVSWAVPQAAKVPVNEVSNLLITSGQDVKIQPNTTSVVTITVPGVKKGDPILVTAQDDYKNWSVYSAWANSNNLVSIRFANFTSEVVDVLGSQYKIVVIK